MIRFAPVLALLAIAPAALAANLARRGDWRLDDSTANGVTTCVMYTATESNNIQYQLDIRHVKNGNGPTEVFMKMQHRSRSSGAQVWKAVNRARREFGFARLSSAAAGSNTVVTFWNIPTSTTALLQDLADRRELAVNPADSTRNNRLTFSHDGFAYIKQQMEEKCLARRPLIDAAFENSFLSDRGRSAVGVSTETAVELRRLLTQAYATKVNQGYNVQALEALRQRFLTQINEKARLTAKIERLSSRDIPAIQQSQAANDTLDASAREDVFRLNNAIPALEASVSGAQQAADRADAALAPHRAEHARLAAASSSAQGSVDVSANRIAAINGQRAQLVEVIRNLQYEAGQAHSAADYAIRNLEGARRDARRSEREFREFDTTREIGRRLRDDREYIDARRNLPDARQELVRLNRAVDAARDARNARQNELNVCLATPATEPTLPTTPTGPVTPTQPTTPTGPVVTPGPTPVDPTTPTRPGGDRPRGDRGGDRPNGDGDRPRGERDGDRPRDERADRGPAQVAAVDCSAAQAALRNANNLLQRNKDEQDEAERRVNILNSRINNIEELVQREVNSIYNSLSQNANAAQANLNGLEATIAANQQRANEIYSFQIPRAEDQIAALDRELPLVENELNRAQPEASRTANSLDAFERRVGWFAKVQALDNAENVLSTRTLELQTARTSLASAQATVSRCGQERQRLAQLLAGNQSDLAQSQASLVSVNQSLVPYEQGKANLDGQGRDLAGQFEGLKQQFENQLPTI